jgi:hypothetical protein
MKPVSLLVALLLVSGCRTADPQPAISPSPLIFSARAGDVLPEPPDGSPSWAVMTSKKLEQFLRKVEP